MGMGRGRGVSVATTLLALWCLIACSAAPTATMPPPTATTMAATAAATHMPTSGALPSPTAALPGRAASPTVAASTGATPGTQACGPGVALLGFSDLLDKTRFGERDVGGLSALVYDEARGVYLALVDNQGETEARFSTLRMLFADGKLGTPVVEAVTTLRDGGGQPFTGRDFDGEGLALLPGGELLISSETEPSIRRFARDGRLLGEVPVPTRFRVKPDGEANANQTFESLTLAPGGHTLFTAVEGPLAADGFTPDLRARIRILRYDGAPDFAPAAQFFYLAETAQGVADLVALSETELLVLERGFIPGFGNTIRVFRVSLAGAADVTARARLTEPDLAPLKKELVLDLAKCPPSGAAHPAKQQNPLLDNFEALALGPPLPDGRRTLWLLSDDNFGADQVTRVIALAWGP